MTALIVGASAGVGRALCEQLAQRGTSLMLVASDYADLELLAAHLRIKYQVEIDILAANARDGSEFINKVAEFSINNSSLDCAYFPIGLSLDNDQVNLSASETSLIITANLTVVIGIINLITPHLLKHPSPLIVGFGSIAGIRGRGNNMVYSAAKKGLESYFESLGHYASTTSLKVQLFKLGYVATQQSYGKKSLFPSITAENAAWLILNKQEKRYLNIYLPFYWSFIGLLLKTLPWSIYKKIGF